MSNPGLIDEKPQRRVVCAACKSITGAMVIAPRHWDKVMHAMNEGICIDAHKAEQGFIDQWGEFMDREEAFKVASAAGQIRHKSGNPNSKDLFSEDLY